MKQYIALFILITVSLQLVSQAHAQESNNNQFQKKIIVQTDNEQAVANHQITCKQIPRKLGNIEQSEIILHELTTDENGEAILTTSDDPNFTYSCESVEPTTKDYCWHFANQTMFFGPNDNGDNSKQMERAIYLVGQESPDTCGKEFTETEIAEGIDNLLPTGSPGPFKNKNLLMPVETVEPEVLVVEELDSEITLWEWFVVKFRSIFNK